jgi:hypothetical protein
MSEVNLQKWAGTILSDGINNFFNFLVWFLWPYFGNLSDHVCLLSMQICVITYGTAEGK